MLALKFSCQIVCMCCTQSDGCLWHALVVLRALMWSVTGAYVGFRKTVKSHNLGHSHPVLQ